MTELSDHVSAQEPEATLLHPIIEPSILALDQALKVEPGIFDPDGQLVPEITTEPSGQEKSFLQKAYHIGKRTLQTGIITLEVLPTNGVITLGVPLAVYAATKSIPATAAASGLLTAGLEGAGGLATADIISNSPDNRLINRVQKLLDSRAVRTMLSSKEGRISPFAEGAIGLYGGTPLVMLARESEPDADDRTQSERRSYGLKVSAALGLICTAQGALYAAGIDSVLEGNPKLSAAAVAGVVGIGAGARVVKNKAQKERHDQESLPRYDLSEKEAALLEKDLLEDVEKEVKKSQGFFGRFRKAPEGVYAVWMEPDNRYANLLRTREAEYFPEVKELDAEIEENTKFLAMVDTRKGSRRVVHATTVSGVDQDPEDNHSSGFTTIDELINMGNFSVQEFRDYYQEKGIDLSRSISVDTNFRVGERAEKVDGLKTADLGYLSLFQLLQSRTPEGVDTVVFASINQDSIDSFERIGLQCEPLMGRRDLKTPEEADGKEFLPVVIPLNKQSRELFQAMNYTVPEINLT